MLKAISDIHRMRDSTTNELYQICLLFTAYLLITLELTTVYLTS